MMNFNVKTTISLLIELNGGFLGRMDDSKKIYDDLKTFAACFDIKDIQNDPEKFFKSSDEFFKQKFEANSISYSELPDRLLNFRSPNETNFPLVWLQAREEFIKEFFPKINNEKTRLKVAVTGYAGIGKSHLALMMALLLRSKNDAFTTIYIPNSAKFQKSPLLYLSSEFFLWFYDLIENSDWLKILVNAYISKDKNMNLLEYVLVECVKEAKKRIKTVVFIQDQINLMRENVVIAEPLDSIQELIDIFFLFTTSTDSRLNSIVRKDGDFGALHYSLNREKFDEPITKKIIIKNFSLEENQNDKNILDFLATETGGDFLMLQEFERY